MDINVVLKKSNAELMADVSAIIAGKKKIQAIQRGYSSYIAEVSSKKANDLNSIDKEYSYFEKNLLHGNKIATKKELIYLENNPDVLELEFSFKEKLEFIKFFLGIILVSLIIVTILWFLSFVLSFFRLGSRMFYTIIAVFLFFYILKGGITNLISGTKNTKREMIISAMKKNASQADKSLNLSSVEAKKLFDYDNQVKEVTIVYDVVNQERKEANEFEIQQVENQIQPIIDMYPKMDLTTTDWLNIWTYLYQGLAVNWQDCMKVLREDKRHNMGMQALENVATTILLSAQGIVTSIETSREVQARHLQEITANLQEMSKNQEKHTVEMKNKINIASEKYKQEAKKQYGVNKNIESISKDIRDKTSL